MTITAPERMEQRPAATGWTKGKADGTRPATPPLQAGDLAGLMAVLDQGLASQEHAEFVASMTAASKT